MGASRSVLGAVLLECGPLPVNFPCLGDEVLLYLGGLSKEPPGLSVRP